VSIVRDEIREKVPSQGILAVYQV